jgi:hypothetical protein
MNEYKLAWILLQAKANDKTKALMAECLKMASDENLINDITEVLKGEK